MSDFRTAARNIFLDPPAAFRVAYRAGYDVLMSWEVPLTGCDAATTWSAAGKPQLWFRDLGCSLDLLAHELAHVEEGDEDLKHNVEFHVLRLLVEEHLRSCL